MSLCDTCRSPGSCCKGFSITQFGFERARWKQHARKVMKQWHFPWYPVEMTVYNEPGWEYVDVRFNCRWLGEDGRCMHYEQRPEACRKYEPLQDGLCAEYVFNFKGIPIRTIHETPAHLHNGVQELQSNPGIVAKQDVPGTLVSDGGE